MGHLIRLFVVSLFAVTASSVSGQAPGCSTNDPDVVCTLQGAVRGVVENDMLAFKGIPYARPPVGQLRWKPTEPAEGCQACATAIASGRSVRRSWDRKSRATKTASRSMFGGH